MARVDEPPSLGPPLQPQRALIIVLDGLIGLQDELDLSASCPNLHQECIQGCTGLVAFPEGATTIAALTAPAERQARAAGSCHGVLCRRDPGRYDLPALSAAGLQSWGSRCASTSQPARHSSSRAAAQAQGRRPRASHHPRRRRATSRRCSVGRPCLPPA